MKKQFNQRFLYLTVCLFLVVCMLSGMGSSLGKYTDTFEIGTAKLSITGEMEPLELWITTHDDTFGGIIAPGSIPAQLFTVYKDNTTSTMYDSSSGDLSYSSFSAKLNAIAQENPNRNIIVHTDGFVVSKHFTLDFVSAGGTLTFQLNPGKSGPIMDVGHVEMSNQLSIKLSNIILDSNGIVSEPLIKIESLPIENSFSNIKFITNYSGEYGSAITVLDGYVELELNITNCDTTQCSGGVGPYYNNGAMDILVNLSTSCDGTVDSIVGETLVFGEDLSIRINMKSGYTLPNMILIRRVSDQKEVYVELGKTNEGIAYTSDSDGSGVIKIPANFPVLNTISIVAWQYYELDFKFVDSHGADAYTVTTRDEKNDRFIVDTEFTLHENADWPAGFTIKIGEKIYTVYTSGVNNPDSFTFSIDQTTGKGNLQIIGTVPELFTNNVVECTFNAVAVKATSAVPYAILEAPEETEAVVNTYTINTSDLHGAYIAEVAAGRTTWNVGENVVLTLCISASRDQLPNHVYVNIGDAEYMVPTTQNLLGSSINSVGGITYNTETYQLTIPASMTTGDIAISAF